MPRKDANQNHSSAEAQQDANSEGIDAFDLPRSLVTRIARSALPDNVKLQKETILALTKGSTVFVNYIGASAHDIAASKQHKSIAASDILKALEVAQFGDMLPLLQTELQAYRDNQSRGKKGGTSSSVSKGKPKDTNASASISASKVSASTKGKERAPTSAGPTITIPPNGSRSTAGQLPVSNTETNESEIAEDELEEGGVHMIRADEEDAVSIPEDEDENLVESEDEDEVEDEDEEPEEEEDTMALEEEELKRDAQGLDAKNPENAKSSEDAVMED
ncbi:histone-fold-containing protein [Panus rudis PR-1116 ss-1]|nr:histone-fold-containing protein [Panus rudis PR-1116 ss-1]